MCLIRHKNRKKGFICIVPSSLLTLKLIGLNKKKSRPSKLICTILYKRYIISQPCNYHIAASASTFSVIFIQRVTFNINLIHICIFLYLSHHNTCFPTRNNYWSFICKLMRTVEKMYWHSYKMFSEIQYWKKRCGLLLGIWEISKPQYSTVL